MALTITYALQITDTLSWLMKVTAFMEPNMVCVERVLDYAAAIDEEADYEIEARKPPLEWPQRGQIQFNNVNLRYRQGRDLVLKNVSFEVNAGERIGVVGRTGAGKSSLTVALFRLSEIADPEGGSIQIDGVKLSQLGLHHVRRAITIIPQVRTNLARFRRNICQIIFYIIFANYSFLNSKIIQDPFLFSATLRINLDPFNEFRDDELWNALEHAHLKAHVETLEKGLEFEVSEGGENLSVGQCQLVCIARAILRKPKILVLDEATAAVDLETDELIQKTIREEFADSSVITIAHRLNTIMDASRILVLENGEVKEFDTPANLLAKSDSSFFSMAVGAGIV